MEIKIREIMRKDTDTVLKMMEEFYSSPAVFTSGSTEIFLCDIESCIQKSPYLEGYVFECHEGIVGYAMVAKSFSTEFGKPCAWIEDLYIKTAFQGKGVGRQFMSFIEKRHRECILRLEVEEENERAVSLYKKCGFTVLPYMEMKK